MPRELRHRFRLVPILGAALLLAACGGGEDEGTQEQQPPAEQPGTAQPAPAPAPSTPAAPEVDPNDVAAAMKYDAGTNTVTYPIISGLTSNAGGWNFNGYARGQMTITVPVGAKVVMPYTNLDAAPHSAGVVEGTATSVPAAPSDVVFPGAATRNFQTGMASGQKDDLRFTADKAGEYLLVCGVPGHPTSGMWVHFVVSATAKEPSVTTES